MLHFSSEVKSLLKGFHLSEALSLKDWQYHTTFTTIQTKNGLVHAAPFRSYIKQKQLIQRIIDKQSRGESKDDSNAIVQNDVSIRSVESNNHDKQSQGAEPKGDSNANVQEELYVPVQSVESNNPVIEEDSAVRQGNDAEIYLKFYDKTLEETVAEIPPNSIHAVIDLVDFWHTSGEEGNNYMRGMLLQCIAPDAVLLTTLAPMLNSWMHVIGSHLKNFVDTGYTFKGGPVYSIPLRKALEEEDEHVRSHIEEMAELFELLSKK